MRQTHFLIKDVRFVALAGSWKQCQLHDINAILVAFLPSSCFLQSCGGLSSDRNYGDHDLWLSMH